MNFIEIYNERTQNELLSCINKDKVGFTLWQLLEDKRRVLKFHNIITNPFQSHLEFIVKLNSLYFESKSYLYFYSTHRTCIFKSKILFNSHFKVITSWPEQMLIVDDRNEYRTTPNGEMAKLRLTINSVFQKDLEKRVLDESPRGIAILVPRNELYLFNQKQVIKIRSSSGGHEGHINYISPLVDPAYKRYVRVGIKFV